jgi:two-component system, LytTR family, response regulator
VLRVTGEFGNVFDAKNQLAYQKAAIIFLDIQLPEVDGLAFVKTLTDPPHVIFTTAYEQYAVKAFEVAACDYLVKPFSLDRFVVAVDRAIRTTKASSLPAGDGFIFLKAEGKIHQVLGDDIIYAEARENYTRVVFAQKVLMTKLPFSDFQNLLDPNAFIRVHRSFIVNRKAISNIDGNLIQLDEHVVPVGHQYKRSFEVFLGIR